MRRRGVGVQNHRRRNQRISRSPWFVETIKTPEVLFNPHSAPLAVVFCHLESVARVSAAAVLYVRSRDRNLAGTLPVMAAGLTVAEPERITDNPQSGNVTDNLPFTITETSA